MQDAKMSPKIVIWAPSYNFVWLYLRNWGTYRQSEKNLLSSDMSSTCLHNMMNFGLLTAEIHSVVWGTPANFNGFRILAALLHGIYSSGRQPNFAALNRGRHLCLAGRPSRWALAHILVNGYFLLFLILYAMFCHEFSSSFLLFLFCCFCSISVCCSPIIRVHFFLHLTVYIKLIIVD